MSIFILPDELVEVHLEGDEENVISVVRKMDIKTTAKVQDELMRVQLTLTPDNESDDESDERGRNGAKGKHAEATVAIMQQELALLYHNIKKWRGPKFMIPRKNKKGDAVIDPKTGEPEMIPIPCTRQWIGLVDPGDPLIRLVLDRIQELNTTKREPVSAAALEQAREGGDDRDPL